MARSVRGIEPLVAAEIRNSRLGRVSGLRHREVWFEPSGSWAGLTGLRTADDVLLVAAVVDGVGPARAALRRLAAAARTITYPGVPAQPGIEVSASFVGRRNYTRFEIEDAVGAELARRLGSPYHSRSGGAAPPGGCVAWRVTIEGDRAVIAVRIAGRPLHRRPYKTASIRGTLHPPLAAAMAGLARLAGARTVLDPCCGAGTTLIEAAALAPQAVLLGLDHDQAAIAAARENARHAEDGADGALLADGARVAGSAEVFGRTADLPGLAGANCTGRGTRFRWGVADAGRVPVAGGSVDRVLVNPPWGRQVPPAGELAREPDRLWREIRRVLARDGLVVALSYDEGGDPPGFETVERVEVSLSGRHPVLAVLRLRERRRASRGRAG
ncbi:MULTISPECIES: methyltransferase domain-containing protein [Nonomuraea]|uniref:Methyltransferase domain-containing protein n=1 Tax=Nonomuraea ferruginea TaxID=46174 RepID=A0ABT4T8N5_9ACTN|nr:methyltransferase domain-containing protein [Nonomuraea ferruginea]MDA0645879.1 methyltransferase domain-containing protein [Nonomuraea ferruginea]